MSDEIPDEILDLLDEDEEVKPIRGWPKYYVTSKGRVFSDKPPRLTELKPWNHGGKYRAVELKKNGEDSIVAISTLVKDHFVSSPSFPLSALHEYILYQYGDSQEAVDWANTVLEDMIDRKD